MDGLWSGRRAIADRATRPAHAVGHAQFEADAKKGQAHQGEEPEPKPWEPLEVGTGTFGEDEHPEQRRATETPSPPVPGSHDAGDGPVVDSQARGGEDDVAGELEDEPWSAQPP